MLITVELDESTGTTYFNTYSLSNYGGLLFWSASLSSSAIYLVMSTATSRYTGSSPSLSMLLE